MLLRLSTILFFFCLIFSSCKTSKNIDSGSTSIDSVEVMRVDTVIVKKTDSIEQVKFDSGTTQVSIIHFNYDSVIRKPYVSKVETYVKQNNVKESTSVLRISDSSSLKKNDSSKVQLTETKFIKNKETKGISFMNLLWLIPIGLIGFIVIKYKSKIKAIISLIK